MTRVLVQALGRKTVSIASREIGQIPLTLNLFKALPMEARNLCLLLLEALQAVVEGICYCDVVSIVVSAALAVIE